MFWKRKEGDKLSKPQDIPEIVRKQINSTMIDSDVVPFLKFVTKISNKGEKQYDFRIFDPSEAEARGLKVVNYDSLDSVNELIVTDGSYDELSKTAAVNIKRNIPKCKIFSKEEIIQKIENLKNPGDQVFFYVAAGGDMGGPLGRGAAVVKLNLTNAEKRRKKYGLYTTSVINMEPVVQKEGLMFDSDKSKDIANWVCDKHKPRFC